MAWPPNLRGLEKPGTQSILVNSPQPLPSPQCYRLSFKAEKDNEWWLSVIYLWNWWWDASPFPVSLNNGDSKLSYASKKWKISRNVMIPSTCLLPASIHIRRRTPAHQNSKSHSLWIRLYTTVPWNKKVEFYVNNLTITGLQVQLLQKPVRNSLKHKNHCQLHNCTIFSWSKTVFLL